MELNRSECRVVDGNWLNRPAGFPADVQVKIRYRHQAAAASLTPADDEAAGIRIHFQKPQKAVTPGQGAVFYDGEEVLGGGWIV